VQSRGLQAAWEDEAEVAIRFKARASCCLQGKYRR
jgi:hypothetical protein